MIPLAMVVDCNWPLQEIIVNGGACNVLLGLKKDLIGKRSTYSQNMVICEVKKTSRVRIPPLA